ncbi:MAG: hypothetical protein K6A63_03435 [Acholeplasmatales bacterium]|nr:hypothetical protein [Acholeplasmatales bacterium]
MNKILIALGSSYKSPKITIRIVADAIMIPLIKNHISEDNAGLNVALSNSDWETL